MPCPNYLPLTSHNPPPPPQPNFDDPFQVLSRVRSRNPWASAKECSFCRQLYCFDCSPNAYCSHRRCGKLACDDDKHNMYWCANCEKHFCRTCRPPVDNCGHNVCNVGACSAQPCKAWCNRK